LHLKHQGASDAGSGEGGFEGLHLGQGDSLLGAAHQGQHRRGELVGELRRAGVAVRAGDAGSTVEADHAGHETVVRGSACAF
jgi:hypothetical protein